jgi:hypothetical protein
VLGAIQRNDRPVHQRRRRRCVLLVREISARNS